MIAPRVCIVAGIRPQFIKAQILLEAVTADARAAQWEWELVLLQQHHDPELQFAISQLDESLYPTVRLGPFDSSIHRGPSMYQEFKVWLSKEGPFDLVVVFGDAEVTLSSALAAAERDIPICHIEAGMRISLSEGPEAVVARGVDCLSEILLCSSHAAVSNLEEEGFHGLFTGDLYLDRIARSALLRSPLEDAPALVSMHHNLSFEKWTAATLELAMLMERRGSAQIDVLVHPKYGEAFNRSWPVSVNLRRAIPHSQMLDELTRCRWLMTDSGGLQREAYYLGCPTLVPRDSSWWPEIVEFGGSRVIRADFGELEGGIAWAENSRVLKPDLDQFGSGRAAEMIVDAIREWAEQQ